MEHNIRNIFWTNKWYVWWYVVYVLIPRRHSFYSAAKMALRAGLLVFSVRLLRRGRLTAAVKRTSQLWRRMPSITGCEHYCEPLSATIADSTFPRQTTNRKYIKPIKVPSIVLELIKQRSVDDDICHSGKCHYHDSVSQFPVYWPYNTVVALCQVSIGVILS